MISSTDTRYVKWKYVVVVCATSLLLSGCPSSPLSGSVPYGFDLSGSWRILSESSDEAPDLNAIAAKELARAQRGKQIDSRSSISFIIQDFPVLVSTSLDIEQDETSMGVAYSNSFYREVSWGKHQMQDWKVNTGWSDGDLVLLLDRHKVDARETFALSERNQLLTITVSIQTPLDKMSLKRVFQRVSQ